MSHLSHVIVFVFQPTEIVKVFDNIHNDLTDNSFEFEDGDFNTIVLPDIDTENGEEKKLLNK
jgi:hypothetical protein